MSSTKSQSELYRERGDRSEYLEDRQRAHRRFAKVVENMHEELFLYRNTGAAKRLLERVDEMAERLKVEQQELAAPGSRWQKS